MADETQYRETSVYLLWHQLKPDHPPEHANITLPADFGIGDTFAHKGNRWKAVDRATADDLGLSRARPDALVFVCDYVGPAPDDP